MTKSSKFILHIGSGESESHAIQAALMAGVEELAAIGVSYWGRNLELAHFNEYMWQGNAIPLHEFSRANNFKNELSNTIAKNIEFEVNRGTKVIIWSNQWIEHNCELVSDILKQFKKVLDFQIIYYVQNIEENIFNKYKQWGVVHKTYEGPVKSIAKFSESRKAYVSINRFLRDFRGMVNIRNSSELKIPIIRDFERCVGLNGSLKIEKQRTNFNELYLRYLFNTRISSPIVPNEFNQFFKLDSVESVFDFESFYKDLEITESLKKEIYEASSDEISLLDAVLLENNQKPISKKASGNLSNIRLSKDELLNMLLNVVQNTADYVDDKVGRERYKDLKIAFICMQKNEGALLKFWFQYYSNLTSPKNLYVIDNCSDDGLTKKVLEQMRDAGCIISRTRDDQNVDDKGNLINQLIDNIGSSYDLVFPVDCDEFLYYHGNGDFSNKYQVIFSELNSFLASSKPIARISKSILNIPGSKNGYFCDAKKVILKPGFRVDLDPGFHLYDWDNKRSKIDENLFYASKLGLFHLHNKPFGIQKKSSFEKLQYRVANFDENTLSAYKGPGAHLIKYFLMSENEYLKSFPQENLFGMRWFINTYRSTLPY